MSAIYFHSKDKTVRVCGSERFYAGAICNNLFFTSMGLNSGFYGKEDVKVYKKLLPQNDYLLEDNNLTTDNFIFHLKIHIAQMDFITVPEKGDVNVFNTILNTALIMGSDAIKFLARLHGQCEIHGYVETINKLWLAKIIEKGRTTNILRRGKGWEDVITLLYTSGDSPIVTSYSVTNTFPNTILANTCEAVFDDMSKEVQWAQSMIGLQNLYNGLELTPDNWNKFFFGDTNLNGFTIKELIKNES